MAVKKKGLVRSKKTKTTPKKPIISRALSMKEPPMKSFRLSREYLPFLTFKITKQTIYWSALLVIILILELWVLKIQIDVIHITEKIVP